MGGLRTVADRVDRLRHVGAARLLVGAGVAYALLALSAFELFGAVTIGVTFFPPAGLTFSLALLLPVRRLPILAVSVIVAEVAVDLSRGQPFWWSLGWAGANLAEPLVGAAITRAIARGLTLDRRFATGVVVGGLLCGPAVGASIGATVLTIANDYRWLHAWADVWVGDSLGVLVVAPAVLVFLLPARERVRRFVPADLIPVAIVVPTIAVLFFFVDSVPLGYLAIPILGWVALRLDERWLAVVALVFACAATAATAGGRGPWAPTLDLTAQAQLARQQLFLLLAIGGSWLLALEARQRLQAVQQAVAARTELDVALERASLVDEVQRAMLPSHLVDHRLVRFGGLYQPASDALAVGGDWYDTVILPNGSVNLTVGDVVGHGVVAAARMGQLNSASRTLAITNSDPSAIVHVLDQVADQIEGADCSTVLCATLDPPTGVLRWCNAGHPPPLVRRPDRRVEVLWQPAGGPLGYASEPRVNGSIELEPGSVVLLFTDGLIDWHRTTIDERMERLVAALRDSTASDPEALAREIVTAMTRGRRALADDIAVLAAFIDAR